MIALGDNSVDKVLDSQAGGSEFDSPEKPGVVENTCGDRITPSLSSKHQTIRRFFFKK